MKEKEWKKIIDKGVYDKLLLEKWDKNLVQVNFYYSNESLMKNGNVTIRIRCIKDIIMLQVKVKTKVENNIRISDEYENAIDIIPYTISEEDIKHIWSDYCFGEISLLGFLVTERRVKQIKNAEVALDRNTYNGVIDYELEIEYKEEKEECREDILNFIDIINSDSKIQIGEGKYNRFLSTLK